MLGLSHDQFAHDWIVCCASADPSWYLSSVMDCRSMCIIHHHVVCIAWNFDVVSVNVQTGHERGLTHPTSDTTSQTNRGAYTATRGCRFQMEPVYVYRVWWAVCRTDEIQGEVSSLQCTEIEIWRIPVAWKLVWYLEDVLQADPKERDTTSQNKEENKRQLEDEGFKWSLRQSA